MIRSTAIAALVVSLLTPSTTVFAQSGRVDPAHPMDKRMAQINSTPTSIGQSVATYDFTAKRPLDTANWSQTPAFQPPSVRRDRSTSRKVWGGIVGTVAGFFAGGYLGIKIEGDSCNCDDPGVEGLLIGAPIGGIIGGIIGAKWF